MKSWKWKMAIHLDQQIWHHQHHILVPSLHCSDKWDRENNENNGQSDHASKGRKIHKEYQEWEHVECEAWKEEGGREKGEAEGLGDTLLQMKMKISAGHHDPQKGSRNSPASQCVSYSLCNGYARLQKNIKASCFSRWLPSLLSMMPWRLMWVACLKNIQNHIWIVGIFKACVVNLDGVRGCVLNHIVWIIMIKSCNIVV